MKTGRDPDRHAPIVWSRAKEAEPRVRIHSACRRNSVGFAQNSLTDSDLDFAIWRWRRLLCLRTLWRDRDWRNRPHHPCSVGAHWPLVAQPRQTRPVVQFVEQRLRVFQIGRDSPRKVSRQEPMSSHQLKYQNRWTEWWSKMDLVRLAADQGSFTLCFLAWSVGEPPPVGLYRISDSTFDD